MIIVIVEAFPAKGKREEYLDFATQLKPELSKMERFIAIERLPSLANPGKVLSFSFWQQESNIVRWRNLESHHQVQAKNSSSVFTNYPLSVAAVMRDDGMSQRSAAPQDNLNRLNQ